MGRNMGKCTREYMRRHERRGLAGAAVAVVAVSLLLVAAGCASPRRARAEFARPTFVIVEHQASALGGDVPDWTTKDIGTLEADPRFEGRYVFRFEETGTDLTGVRNVSNNMSAPAEVARLISMRVEQVFAGAQVGDQDFVETYFENIVKTVASAQISGLRKYGEYWVLKEYTTDDGSPGRREYSYYTLYWIDHSRVEDLIERALTGLDARTEEEVTARERVRRLLRDEGF